MARAGSKSSGSKGNQSRDTEQPDSSPAPEDAAVVQGGDGGGDSAPLILEGVSSDTPPAEIGAEPPATKDDSGIEAAPPEPETPQDIAQVAPPPAPPPAPRQGGFAALVLGGLVAAGIGYGAAYMGWLPTRGAEPSQNDTIAQALAPLQEQIAALVAATPPAPEPVAPVDLSPVMTQLETLADRIDALALRVGALEDRPALADDAQAQSSAAQAIEAEMETERAAIAARTAELEAAAQAALSEAQAAIATAELEAAAARARAEAQAALGQIQAALASGKPFADALATIAAVTPAADALTSVAETGLSTRADLQEGFAPLARAALPVALQETAGEGLGERLGAFVMGQIGGRAVEPREGDSPDAVLSRVEAAIRAGDLPAALTEIAALPEGARAVLAPWVADVENRVAAEAGLATLIAALSADGN